MIKTVEEIKKDILLFDILEGRYNPFYADEIDEDDEEVSYEPGIGVGDYSDDSLYILNDNNEIVGIQVGTSEENLGHSIYFDYPNSTELLRAYYLWGYDSLFWRSIDLSCFERLEKKKDKTSKKDIESAVNIWNNKMPRGVLYVINDYCKTLWEKRINILSSVISGNQVLEQKEIKVIPYLDELYKLF